MYFFGKGREKDKMREEKNILVFFLYTKKIQIYTHAGKCNSVLFFSFSDDGVNKTKTKQLKK